MDLLVGTTNRGKFIEISEALAGFPLRLLHPLDLDIAEAPVEEGATYDDNARFKAEFFHKKSGLPTIADDSGIVVEALQNELGLHTRRWGAGPAASDDEWITYFLKRMEKETHRRARFHCSICYIDPKGAHHFFEGDCPGTITKTLEADYLPGLPISACFRPDGFDRVFSALSPEQKNTISHRGKAIHALSEYLRNELTN